MHAITTIVPEIKQQYDLKICACLGLLTPEQAERLKACGVDRVNHNVNTSSEYYEQICKTHTYQDRLDTLQAVRQAGLELCSGGIIGMGESKADIVRMAFELRDLQVESIPVNFLNPIDGTPLAGLNQLTPRDCLKALAMFRFVNPDRELRIAGGRELHLGSMQCLGLYAANSLFVGDYLTTQGQPPEEDYRMIEEMGFTITKPRNRPRAFPARVAATVPVPSERNPQIVTAPGRCRARSSTASTRATTMPHACHITAEHVGVTFAGQPRHAAGHRFRFSARTIRLVSGSQRLRQVDVVALSGRAAVADDRPIDVSHRRQPGPPQRAYVFQDANLLPWRTVKRQRGLALGIAGADAALHVRQAARQAMAVAGLADSDDGKRPATCFPAACGCAFLWHERS